MRVPYLRALSALVILLIAGSASAVTMDWTFVGNPGNACESQSDGCFGAVGYEYYIGTYEVTNAQYTEFLNAKAASDPLGLYDTNMSSSFPAGITRGGSSGSYTYSAISGRENMPVNFVSFYDALRFANWMNNGQGSGDTETGSYTLLGGTATPSNGTIATRTVGAAISITSENEWYKAAYYDARSASYFDYPARSNAPTTCSAPSPFPNRANCGRSDLTAVGSYTGSASPYGTYDQGGNLWEWNESIYAFLTVRGMRGGSYEVNPPTLAAETRLGSGAAGGQYYLGFRLVMIPEPSTGLLVIAGLLGIAGWRKAHA